MFNPKTFVSLKTLSRDSGLDRTRIIHWIKVLEEAGWVEESVIFCISCLSHFFMLH
ncbi:MAG: helix-turn-helix domain-containing protein [Candidatus Aminicenantes bacterium]|nr:helix-turn-helix domain-containing protein [Candidatus Aminicenantes bacterium]MBL7083906.1 helix-turn-helix domain-containing protein [Candidatus Aminicenantes bacterium]